MLSRQYIAQTPHRVRPYLLARHAPHPQCNGEFRLEQKPVLPSKYIFSVYLPKAAPYGSCQIHRQDLQRYQSLVQRIVAHSLCRRCTPLYGGSAPVKTSFSRHLAQKCAHQIPLAGRRQDLALTMLQWGGMPIASSMASVTSTSSNVKAGKSIAKSSPSRLTVSKPLSVSKLTDCALRS